MIFFSLCSKSPVPLNYRGGMLEIHDSIALKSRKNLSLAVTKVTRHHTDFQIALHVSVSDSFYFKAEHD